MAASAASEDVVALPGVRWSRGANGEPRRVTHLLDADAELAERVPSRERALARRTLVVPVQRVPRGPWSPQTGETRPVAYVILEGTILRGCRVADRWSTELLGPEDVLRPWEEAQDFAGESEWHALVQLQLAQLDRRLIASSMRWPELVDELLARTVRRSRHLAMLRCVCGIRRLDVRLLVLLRVLAGRWGRVSLEGTHVGIPLTHEAIARLAGAQRPSVSTALARLRSRGLVHVQDRQFVLAADLPVEVEAAMRDVA
jgi:CRP-like cAMP-binding protein